MVIKSNRWEDIKTLPPIEFRRLTGVKVSTFDLMVQAVNAYEAAKKKSGKPHRLPTENRVLLCLEYLRDYPTYLRLAVNWGIHESTAKRIQNRVEDILVKAPQFRISGKKKLSQESNLKVVVIDASERPIERPKKTKDLL